MKYNNTSEIYCFVLDLFIISFNLILNKQEVTELIRGLIQAASVGKY
jgi:hypothetical protein